jgi:cold shock CspA family protein
MHTENKYYIGVVDWFGGMNKKTGKKNSFGFISTPNKASVYVHKKAIEQGDLEEDDIVIFNITSEKDKRLSANNVLMLKSDPEGFFQRLLQALSSEADLSKSLDNFDTIFNKLFNFEQSYPIVKMLAKNEQRLPSLLKQISKSTLYEQHFSNLMQVHNLSVLIEFDIPAFVIPDKYICDNYELIYQWWYALQEEKKKKHLATQAIKHLVGSDTLTSFILSKLKDDRLNQILSELATTCGVLPDIIRILASARVNNDIILNYLKEIDLETYLDETFPSWLLPLSIRQAFVIDKLKSITPNSTDTLLVAKLIIKNNIVKHALDAVDEEEQYLLVTALAKASPPSINTINALNLFNNSRKLLDKYIANCTLESLLSCRPNTQILTDNFINLQLSLILNELSIPKKDTTKQLAKLSINFAIEFDDNFLINIKNIHPTYFSDVINTVEKVHEKKLLTHHYEERIKQYAIEPYELTFIFPFLKLINNESKQCFFQININSIVQYFNNIQKERADSVLLLLFLRGYYKEGTYKVE